LLVQLLHSYLSGLNRTKCADKGDVSVCQVGTFTYALVFHAKDLRKF